MNPAIIKDLTLGVILVGVFVVLPIVSTVFQHQRKMAKIQRSDLAEEDRAALMAQIGILKGTVEELRQELTQSKITSHELSERFSEPQSVS